MVKQHPSTNIESSSHLLWVRAIPELGALPQDSTPTTYYHTRQIHITYIMLVDVSVKSWIVLN